MDFAFPFSLAIAKLLASDYVACRIQARTEYESVRRILALFTAQIVKIAVNVLLLLVAVYGAGWVLSRRMSVLVICTVYMASVIESLVRLLRGLPDLFSLVFMHRCNPRDFIRMKVQREVCQHLGEADVRSSLFRRLFKKIMLRSNEELAREVAHKAAPAIWRRVVGRFMVTAAALVAYIVVFRFLVAPYLITGHTKLTGWQALLYPVAYASDYFFGTSLVKYVHTLRFRLFG
ncbi:MAG: hypothetical protein HGB21_08095 [Nitrospirae bacterium]|nr:hypothetical protein [Nitrospirota bacterium]NTW66249.1 hypothetical protein [Nitrospirota bacterium]